MCITLCHSLGRTHTPAIAVAAPVPKPVTGFLIRQHHHLGKPQRRQ